MHNIILLQIGYAVLATFHNFMFAMFILFIIRIFKDKHTPYSAFYVGLYSCAHSLYNGCPLLEIQNYMARQFNGPQEKIGAYRIIFGDNADLVRLAVFVGGALLIYYAYRTWFDAPVKVQWSNIFKNYNNLTFSNQ